MKPKFVIRKVIITLGTTVWINLFTDRETHMIEAATKKAMAKGATIQWADGRKEWIEVREQTDGTKRGSAMYTWDKSGNKVKANIIVKSKDKSGKITERQIGTKFVAL